MRSTWKTHEHLSFNCKVSSIIWEINLTSPPGVISSFAAAVAAWGSIRFKSISASAQVNEPLEPGENVGKKCTRLTACAVATLSSCPLIISSSDPKNGGLHIENVHGIPSGSESKRGNKMGSDDVGWRMEIVDEEMLFDSNTLRAWWRLSVSSSVSDISISQIWEQHIGQHTCSYYLILWSKSVE